MVEGLHRDGLEIHFHFRVLSALGEQWGQPCLTIQLVHPSDIVGFLLDPCFWAAVPKACSSCSCPRQALLMDPSTPSHRARMGLQLQATWARQPLSIVHSADHWELDGCCDSFELPWFRILWSCISHDSRAITSVGGTEWSALWFRHICVSVNVCAEVHVGREKSLF